MNPRSADQLFSYPLRTDNGYLLTTVAPMSHLPAQSIHFRSFPATEKGQSIGTVVAGVPAGWTGTRASDPWNPPAPNSQLKVSSKSISLAQCSVYGSSHLVFAPQLVTTPGLPEVCPRLAIADPRPCRERKHVGLRMPGTGRMKFVTQSWDLVCISKWLDCWS